MGDVRRFRQNVTAFLACGRPSMSPQNTVRSIAKATIKHSKECTQVGNGHLYEAMKDWHRDFRHLTCFSMPAALLRS